MTRWSIPSPLGRLTLEVGNGAIRAVRFMSDRAVAEGARNGLFQQASLEFMRYFEDPTFMFSVPLELGGTLFQRKVWAALRRIPPGTTCSYGEMARRLGSSPRAVGNACRRNPCPVIVPCHRVVSANGLGGYAGATGGPLLARKRWLLAHEGVIVDG